MGDLRKGNRKIFKLRGIDYPKMADIKLSNDRFREILNAVEAALKKADDKVKKNKDNYPEAMRELTAFFQAFSHSLHSDYLKIMDWQK